MEGARKINLGCGCKKRLRYINLDRDKMQRFRDCEFKIELMERLKDTIHAILKKKV